MNIKIFLTAHFCKLGIVNIQYCEKVSFEFPYILTSEYMCIKELPTSNNGDKYWKKVSEGIGIILCINNLINMFFKLLSNSYKKKISDLKYPYNDNY